MMCWSIMLKYNCIHIYTNLKNVQKINSLTFIKTIRADNFQKLCLQMVVWVFYKSIKNNFEI